MLPRTIVDITNRTNEAAITLLCTFNAQVKTSAGEIVPAEADGFALVVPGKKTRMFPTASGAVEVLRRLTRN
jgi:hypothetical protein